MGKAILNELFFWQNSNIELNQIGYRPPLGYGDVSQYNIGQDKVGPENIGQDEIGNHEVGQGEVGNLEVGEDEIGQAGWSGGGRKGRVELLCRLSFFIGPLCEDAFCCFCCLL